MPTHPVAPGHRFALDLDGSVLYQRVNPTLTWTDITASLASLVAFNAGSTISMSVGSGQHAELSLLFPEPRLITGLRWSGYSSRGFSYTLNTYVSTDTTDGANGTWTNLTPSGGVGTPDSSLTTFRSQIAATGGSAIRGMRFRITDNYGSTHTFYFRDLHIYGLRDAVGDHLQFWHPTDDVAPTYGHLDYGDIYRGVQQASRQLRVKNTSATLTASGITVSYADYAGVEFGGPAGEVSLDGVAWAASIDLANIAPGGISPAFYFRLNSSATIPPAPRTGRLRVAATGWA